ncbi:MAG: hypothetical protein A2042_07000 [Candidatus Schekmanbacteria bacterium GWA2_38_11]|uniref:HTH tetR-type domain-containing protein n=1 Tax=Candidatus Schekmanbacteria bacterium GWA2_38_11 TaxID=1817876 RepID=A0A1F7RB20_9BACT|nr:MAG: hypothetical protein A2042_07000 [Candidatus Schekmanbacteria bacterium GWA2_38_11]
MNHREQEILSAAAKIFREKGYQRATIQDVAEEVGLLKGSIYYYIKSKQELLFKIGITPLKAITDELKGIVSQETSPEEKLRAAIKTRLKAFDEYYPDIFVFLHERFDELPEKERSFLKKGQKEDETLWIKILKEGIEKGTFRKGVDIKMTAKAISGMCHWMYKWYKKDGRLSTDQIAEVFFDFVINGIKEREK